LEKIKKERIILGLDPGTLITGYGIIAVTGAQLKLLQFGVLQLAKYASPELKLKKIFERVLGLLEEFHPDEVALEAPFFGKNVQSMLKLGRAQGVAIAAALSREISVTEYAPRKVKQAVTGNGNASKEQVAGMLKKIFAFREDPKFFDATDALAVALCHCFQKGNNKSSNKSWNQFVTEHPGRVASISRKPDSDQV
jgi:crossover junction endodeoxyribonuclease RuvC